MAPTDRDRDATSDRLAVTEALLRLLDSWEEVGKAIAQTENRQAAIDVLSAPPHSFTPAEASYVMDFPLGRRTVQARLALEEEVRQLRTHLA